jgi:hypothetical protein
LGETFNNTILQRTKTNRRKKGLIMWRPFDNPAKRRKRFIEKNSPYLVPLAVGGLAAMGDENASTRQRIKRGLVTGGQTFAAMKTAGVFANNASKKNYYRNTILPTVQQARGIANTGLNLRKDIRAATKFDFWKKKKGLI